MIEFNTGFPLPTPQSEATSWGPLETPPPSYIVVVPDQFFDQANDTATAADSGSVLATATGTDTATGSDASSVVALIAGAETAAGADASSVLGTMTGSDAGSGADSAGVTGTIGGSETSSPVDAASLARLASASEAGAGADLAAVLAMAAAIDAAAAADLAAVLGLVGPTDAASGLDDAHLAGVLAAAELPLGVDDGTVRAQLAASDASVSSETVTVDSAGIVVQVVAGDIAGAEELASVTFQSVHAFQDPRLLGHDDLNFGHGMRRQKRPAESVGTRDRAGAAAWLGAEDRLLAVDAATVRRYPGPAMVNSFVIAAIVAIEESMSAA